MINLYHIDCMNFMKDKPDGFYDLAIVDPPYGIGEDGGRNRPRDVVQKNGSTLYTKPTGHKKGNWDNKTPDATYFDELFRVSNNQIVWGVNYFTPIFWFTAGRIFWDKINGSNDFSDGELAFCSSHNSTRLFRYMWNGMMQGSSANGEIMEGNKALNEKRTHPTQKPVRLYEWLLINYAKKGDKILDTHLGSGSIAIACHNLGFDLDGCEIDKEYYDGAVKRFNNHKKQLTMF